NGSFSLRPSKAVVLQCPHCLKTNGEFSVSRSAAAASRCCDQSAQDGLLVTTSRRTLASMRITAQSSPRVSGMISCVVIRTVAAPRMRAKALRPTRGTPGCRHSASQTRVNALMAPPGLRLLLGQLRAGGHARRGRHMQIAELHPVRRQQGAVGVAFIVGHTDRAV